MLSQQLQMQERGVNWFCRQHRLITPAAVAVAVAAARSLTANLARLCPHSHRVLRLSGIHCCCCDCSGCDCCYCCCGKCSCLAGNHLHFSLLPEAKCQLQVVYVGGVQLWLHLFLFLLFIIQLCARMHCVPVPPSVYVCMYVCLWVHFAAIKSHWGSKLQLMCLFCSRSCSCTRGLMGSCMSNTFHI